MVAGKRKTEIHIGDKDAPVKGQAVIVLTDTEGPCMTIKVFGFGSAREIADAIVDLLHSSTEADPNFKVVKHET